MKQLVIFPKGTLEAKDRERLTKSGFLAIESTEPNNVILLMPSANGITSNDLLMSAMAGIGYPDRFVAELHRRLKLKDKPEPKAGD